MTYYVLKYFLGGYFWFNKEGTWLKKKKIVSESIQTCLPSQHTFPPMQKNISEDKFYTKCSDFISGVLSHSLQYRGQLH